MRLSPGARITFFVLAILLGGRAMSEDLHHELVAKYSNKMFVIRNFYAGTHLSYDSAGQLLGTALSGDWTADGIVSIEKLKVTHRGVEFQADRVIAYAQSEKGFQLTRSGQSVKLEIQANPDALTSSQVDAILSHVLLNADDRFSELIPEFWKTCVQLAIAKVENEKLPKCRFSNDLISLVGANPPAIALAAERASLALGTSFDPRNPPVYRVGQGVTPPKPISHTDPKFTDAARSAGIQGKLTLGVIVDSSGTPTGIQVVQPLGAGLDAHSVETVKGWRFKPAEKDGQPVAVRIGVEVEFQRQ
jgi:TonB family protein